MIRVRIFLEIFSGCGRLSAAMARRGFQILAWDVKWGPAYDLMMAKNRRLIRGWILSRAILAVHLGTPCKSWSRARDRHGGPPPLRSNDHIWGLPDRRPGDQIAINIGSILARFTVSVLFACRHMHIPGTMENPASSRIWLCPPVKRFLASSGTDFAITDFCQWGTPWLKPTASAGVYIDLEPIRLRCRFRSDPNKCCSRSGCRHQVLAGQTSEGVFWTLVAEAYPRRLCTKLASCFDAAIVSTRAAVLGSILNRPAARALT